MPAAKARAVLRRMSARRAASRAARVHRSAMSPATSEMEPRALAAPAMAARACCVPQEPAAAETQARARSASCPVQQVAPFVSTVQTSQQARSVLAAPAPPEPAALAACTSVPVIPGRAEVAAALAVTHARSVRRGSAVAVCATAVATPSASSNSGRRPVQSADGSSSPTAIDSGSRLGSRPAASSS